MGKSTAFVCVIAALVFGAQELRGPIYISGPDGSLHIVSVPDADSAVFYLTIENGQVKKHIPPPSAYADSSGGATRIGGKTLAEIDTLGHGKINDSIGVKENSLGTPTVGGYILSSSAGGLRSWVAPYSHPTQSAINPMLTGAKVLASLTVNTKGHTTAATTRTLSPGDIGAAATSHPHTRADVTDLWLTPFWANIPDKPAVYPPDSHTHSASNITSGTLSTSRYSAYSDLVAESKIGSATGQVSAGDHLHDSVYLPLHGVADSSGGATRIGGKTLAEIDTLGHGKINDSIGVKENSLGTPTVGGYILSSSAGGLRSWVAPYSHPTQSPINLTLTGAKVLSSFSVNPQGHTTVVTTRDLTPAEIGAVDIYDIRLSNARTPTPHGHSLASVLATDINGSDGYPLLQISKDTIAYLGSTNRYRLVLASNNIPEWKNGSGNYYDFWTESNLDTSNFARDSDLGAYLPLAGGEMIGDIDIDATNGMGIKFWNGGERYSIYMSKESDAILGGRLDATSDYNVYFTNGASNNRGWVFKYGEAGSQVPVAQIDGAGKGYFKGGLEVNGTDVSLSGHNHGTGTTNYLPVFTDGATGTLGNSFVSQSTERVLISKNLDINDNFIGYSGYDNEGIQVDGDGKLIVYGKTATSGGYTGSRYLITARDTTNMADAVGGGIKFDGKYNTAGEYAPYALVSGVKSNGTDGDKIGEMRFFTNGGSGLVQNMYLTSLGNLVLGATSSDTTSNKYMKVLSGNGFNAGFEAYGTSQGTGYLYVGQDVGDGGGIFYNGDTLPKFAENSLKDRVSFFRRAGGSAAANNTVVFSYPNTSNDVTFEGSAILKNGSLSVSDAINFTNNGTARSQIYGTSDGEVEFYNYYDGKMLEIVPTYGVELKKDYSLYLGGAGALHTEYINSNGYDLYLTASNANINMTCDTAKVKADLNVGDIDTSQTTDRVVRVMAPNAYNAGFEAYGYSQGTGYFYVGQSTTTGGGIYYNGDGTPTFATGELADKVTFFRRASSTNYPVFYYSNSSSNVIFKGSITSATDITAQNNIFVNGVIWNTGGSALTLMGYNSGTPGVDFPLLAVNKSANTGIVLNATPTGQVLLQGKQIAISAPEILDGDLTKIEFGTTDYVLTVTKPLYKIKAGTCNYKMVMQAGTDGQRVTFTRITGTGPVCANVWYGKVTTNSNDSGTVHIGAGHAQSFIYDSDYGGWLLDGGN